MLVLIFRGYSSEYKQGEYERERLLKSHDEKAIMNVVLVLKDVNCDHCLKMK